MDIIETALDGVLVIQSKAFEDERGYFVELWREEAGVGGPFVQNNRTLSRRGVLRGLHFQSPRSQKKLVRVDFGEVFDVAVDVRPDSPTFGRWHGEILSDANHRQLWIPDGFAHGFLALSERAVVGYLCSDYFIKEDDRAIAWNDPDIAVDWPLDRVGEPVISARDQEASSLADWRASRG